MEFYPVQLSLRNRHCLIVGSGPFARQQALALNQCGAIVTMVNADTTDTIPGVTHQTERVFQGADLDRCWFVVVDSTDNKLTQTLVDACEARGILCSLASDADRSTATPVSGIPQPTVTNSSRSESEPLKGHVSLVGAGPGDPALLTLRALELIQSASVIVYDRLVSEPVMALCRPDAKLIYAGKAKSDHALPQESINQLLVDLAQQGHTVVRLKGGDPFIFGRGGEEIETLAEQSIPFEVVPGITAASGCSAFSGIPLTHRDHAQSCIFITGHLRSGEINLDWENLQDSTQTIVVYMGLTGLEKICESLINNGRDPATKAALIERGTTPRQQVHVGTLKTLPAIVAASDVSAPTLLIIGDVVSLRGKLQWF
ncbi:MAG: uroporphyrinogen-III C-methyltransferase [Granulosicoccus sp.]|nr:uroporphyrinogen-III C-methyltransferase [Granulosicoccus sp.]